MGSCFPERRSFKSNVAGLAPPLDREIGLAGLGEMMGNQLGLRARSCNERLRRMAMQSLPSALDEALVGRVLDEGVLEAIGRLGCNSFNEQNVRLR